MELGVSRQEIFAVKDNAAGRTAVSPGLLVAMLVARQGVLGTVGPFAFRAWVHAVRVSMKEKRVHELFDPVLCKRAISHYASRPLFTSSRLKPPAPAFAFSTRAHANNTGLH